MVPILGLAMPAQAAESQFLLTPYLWLSSVDSRIGTPLGTVATETSFGDIVSNLDFGFMATMEWRRGRLGLIGDITYMNLATTREAPLAGFVSADGRLKPLGGTGYVAWRAADMTVADIDLLAGFRLFSIDTRVALDIGGMGGPTFERNATWADPVVGVRIALPLSERWTATDLVDVGGFGVGSDLSWQGLAKLSYRFSRTISGELGYRHL